MFAMTLFITDLSQSLTLCSDSMQSLVYYRLNSAVLVYTHLITSLCCIHVRGVLHKNQGVIAPPGGLDKSLDDCSTDRC